MNTQTFMKPAGAGALAVLLGCSTQAPVTLVAVAPSAISALADLEISETPSTAPWPEPVGKFCKLGTSCLSMDPRPFELCLLSTKDCRDKATEPLLVGQPQSIDPPLIIKTTR